MPKSELQLIEETPSRVVYRVWRQTHGPGGGRVPGMHPQGCVFIPPIVALVVLGGSILSDGGTTLWAKIGCGVLAAPLLFLVLTAFSMGGGLRGLPAQVREAFTKREVWQHVRIVLDGEARRITLEGEDPRHPYGHAYEVDHIDAVNATAELRDPSSTRRDDPRVYLFMNERYPPTMMGGHELRRTLETIELPSEQDAVRVAGSIRALFGLPKTRPESTEHRGQEQGTEGRGSS